MLTTETQQNTYTVSALTGAVRALLETEFAVVWVEGEISNLATPSSGHIYFTLKDEASQVRCAFFRAGQKQLGFQLQNGIQILASARVSLYQPRGDFQLIVEHAEPAGDGRLRLQFEQLKKRLANEGLFDPAHKKPLPTFAKQIGVITSPSGAAIRDIISVLKRRFPLLPVIIYPTPVQGDTAAKQIADAIALANRHSVCDVLIVSRGGGSLEDLWPFNEEIVARAIYASALPIVSGVGHEIDFTIADFVADHRAPTPSAAAELVSPDQQKWLQQLQLIHQRLIRVIQSHLMQDSNLLQQLSKRLRHPIQKIRDQIQNLDQLEMRLQRSMQHTLQHQQHALAKAAAKLQILSPLNTLARGYALVTDQNGKILHQATQVALNSQITATLAEGKLHCLVVGCEENR